MKHLLCYGGIILCAHGLAAEVVEPKFRAVTVDDRIQIGYGVAVADVDGDKKLDILLADKRQFVWYRNPAWDKFLIAENLTPKDNVCLAAQDIDGDGKCELAVGAEWNPGDTENSGAVFYMIAPPDRTQQWKPVKLHAEPTTHRMRWIKLRSGKWGLVVVPLHGRGNKNGEGAGVKVMLYQPSSSPDEAWKTELIDDSMHMTHNFECSSFGEQGSLLLCGREGVAALNQQDDSSWKRTTVQVGHPGSPFKPAGEIRSGYSPSGRLLTAVEPMHGNSLVCYLAAGPEAGPRVAWTRDVLSDKLSEGHALGCGDLLGVGSDQIVVGWRGKPGAADSTTGVALWIPLDAKGKNWRENVIDPNGMACEDLQLADLDGDGKLDIVASGRATKNVKIYFNETPR